MATTLKFSDAEYMFGISLTPYQVVGIPAECVRWKLKQGARTVTRLFLKFQDGRFECWDVEWSDETRRAIKPKMCIARNTLRVVFKGLK